jgi:hypothetical protein
VAPASLLEQQDRLADTLFASTRHFEVQLHFNKGLAGASEDNAGSKVNVTVDVLDISKAIDQYSSAIPATQDMSGHLPIVVSFI